MPFYLIIYRMRWIVFVLLPCRVQWHCGELCKQYREETEETVVSSGSPQFRLKIETGAKGKDGRKC